MTIDENPRKSFLIVGIGASAGGLSALQRFLAELPADYGFALVFIQHLSSKHKSLLSELLSARRPSLVIQQISDGLKVQPGRLYLAPPGREIRLRNSLFQTTVHPEGLIHLPIDEFLSSLAEDAAERSIAVVFSGAGTDGARGCRAIRSVGGTVFIQDPKTAEFDSMPLAAIATGQADAVLSPEDIAAELLKLQGIGQAVVSRELPITPEEFDGFFRILREMTGSRFDYYKKSVVSRRIRRRMYLHGLSVVRDYLDMLRTSDPEAAHLASDLMIGVTSFFRDRVAWKALNVEAVRKIAAENTDLPVRVWTPASATGEEAYSIAMMLLNELALAGEKRELQVFATDVNDRALERAREGKYPSSITADVSQEYIQKYFTSTDNGDFLVVNKDVRECVVFARQDLVIDPPFSKLDLIICRNFLIYLEPEAQEKSITLFHYALKEGGYLFLGNAETVGRKNAFFKSIGHKHCRVYRKLKTKPASRLHISVPCATERKAPLAKQTQMMEQGRSVIEIIQEKLLEEYGPASVAIDQNHEIIYHNGPTNRYLRQPRGVPTQNFLELVPENLRSRIRGALYRSGREERPVVIRTSVAGDDNKTRHVTLRITKAAENLAIVVFQDKITLSKKEAAEQVDATVIEETAIHQLESELSATRADLQSNIEQLKSLNEELQSSNEELQAANEELETSREELQSLNEELITVNSQLQGKIEEQDATNDDLNNFQASTNIPMIFLDTHFRVKRFTPAMLKLIKLLPSDIGRPIVDMSQENLGPDLTSDAQGVLEGLAPARRELEISGAWYVRTTLPYRTADNRIEGVVITYTDITEVKRAEERTQHLASFPELNPNPICEVHASGKVNFCNPATEKVLTNIGMATDNFTVFLPEDMDDILRDMENKEEETSFYREKVIKNRIFGMTVHLVPQFNVVRIYAYDITERKRSEVALRESEKRLNRSQEIAHLGSWELDLVNNHLTWSDEVYRIFGLQPQEFGATYEAFLEAVHPDDRAAVDAAYSGSLREGRDTYEIEHRIVRKSAGEIRYVHEKCEHVRDETGRHIRSVGMVLDITERKKAEDALRQSEDKYRRIVETANEGIWVVDADRRTTFVNDKMAEILGYSAHEMIGKSGLEFLGEESRALSDANIVKRRQGVSESFELKLLRKDKTTLWALVNATSLFHTNGEFAGSLSMLTDITVRKRAEEVLRESEERFRALTMASSDVVYRMSPDWSEMRQLSGRGFIADTENPSRTWLQEYIHPDDQAHVKAVIDEAIRTKSIFELEHRVLRVNGTLGWMFSLAIPLLDTKGEIVEWLGAASDITERKQAEEALRESNEELTRFNNAAVGRELRMIELKKELNECCGKAGLPPRYPLDVEEEQP